MLCSWCGNVACAASVKAAGLCGAMRPGDRPGWGGGTAEQHLYVPSCYTEVLRTLYSCTSFELGSIFISCLFLNCLLFTALFKHRVRQCGAVDLLGFWFTTHIYIYEYGLEFK